MSRRSTGSFFTTNVGGEKVQAFIPLALPPIPELTMAGVDRDVMEKAILWLGRLDGVASLLPDVDLFIYFYVRKEAVLSSQIEGTQSSLSDLLLFENEEPSNTPQINGVEEVSRYVAAMEHGLRRLRSPGDGLPLSLRLIGEIHEKLLATGRGSDKSPGEIRTTQNWVGGTRPGNALFVPPPPHEVMNCLGALEKFLHDDPVKTSPLIKAALAHVQFETIHPYLDGNGRLGRLLVTFILCVENMLSKPLLYLSLYFKTHRNRYYELLQRVRTHGEWEEWISFFMEGVAFTAEQGVMTARSIRTLFESVDAEIRARSEHMKSRVANVLMLHGYMQKRPSFTIGMAAQATGLSHPTISTCIDELVNLGHVRELTNRQRNRIFQYAPYMRILNEGTDQPLR